MGYSSQKAVVYLGEKTFHQSLLPLMILVYDSIWLIIHHVLISTNGSNICLPFPSYALKLCNIIYFPILRFNHFLTLVLDFSNRLGFKMLSLWLFLCCYCTTVDHFLHLKILLLLLLILYSCFHVL